MTANRSIFAGSGFAVIEAVISSLIIGLMIATSVQLVGASRSSQAWSANRVRAHELAADLLAEITDKRYSDPDFVVDAIGPGADEGAGRSVYDDVDDYHNLVESPPRKADGTVMAGYSGWTRSVQVAWVTLADLSQTSITSTGIKRITVTISKDNRTLAQLVSIRTSAVNR
jgi:hypothetical protein